MENYASKIPSFVYGGSGCLEKIKTIVSNLNTNKAIIITDEGVENAGLCKPLLQHLKDSGVTYTIFNNVKPEPDYTIVQQIADKITATQGDFIIGIGGGSVMDTAKLCAALSHASYTIKDLLKDPGLAKKSVPTIMIPTTCGTGSEATCNAIVAVPEENIKVGIVSDELIPDYALLDPEMIRRLPPAIVAATGVDALSHAVECYTSNKANPLSDVYALASAKLIFENIRAAYKNPQDINAKNNMLIGAFYGGAAITASGTTAVHALSYPLGGKFHIPHGVSNAILFAHVMAFNMDACADRLAAVCDAINPYLSTASTTEKAKFVVDEIADIVKSVDIPTSLSGFGVKEEDLAFLVDAGSKVKRLLDNNPKVMTPEDIRSIYQKVL